MLDYIKNTFFSSSFAMLKCAGEIVFCLGAALLAGGLKPKCIKWYLRLLGMTALGFALIAAIEYLYWAVTGDNDFSMYLSKPIAVLLQIVLLGSGEAAGKMLTAATYGAMYFSFLGVSSFLGSSAGLQQLTIVLFSTLVSVAVVYLIRFDARKFFSIPHQYIWLSVLINTSTVLLPLLAGLVGDANEMLLVFTLFMLFIQVTTYTLIYSAIREHDRNMELLAFSERQEAEKNMTELSAESLSRLREIRHDVKNQYAYMRRLLSELRYEELSEYFEGLDGELQEIVNYIDCGNSTVNAIINIELIKAQNKGIDLDIKITLPQKLTIPDHELTSLVTNVIDNALEACEREGVLERTVDFGLRVHGDYLLLRSVNPIPPGADEKRILRGVTTKSDRTLHGFGSRIIDRIAEKYDGIVTRNIVEGKYVMDVMLALPEEEIK